MILSGFKNQRLLVAKKQNQQKNKGFTIIETLIVVAIISILVVIGSIKQKSSLQRKNAEIEAMKIKQMLEVARDYALTGEAVSGKVPQSFTFSINKTDNSYKITSLDPAGTQKQGQVEASNILINSCSNPLTVTYTVPYATMTCSCSPCTISVCGNKDNCSESLTYTLTILNDKIEIK